MTAFTHSPSQQQNAVSRAASAEFIRWYAIHLKLIRCGDCDFVRCGHASPLHALQCVFSFGKYLFFRSTNNRISSFIATMLSMLSEMFVLFLYLVCVWLCVGLKSGTWRRTNVDSIFMNGILTNLFGVQCTRPSALRNVTSPVWWSWAPTFTKQVMVNLCQLHVAKQWTDYQLQTFPLHAHRTHLPNIHFEFWAKICMACAEPSTMMAIINRAFDQCIFVVHRARATW